LTSWVGFALGHVCIYVQRPPSGAYSLSENKKSNN
jgi:hypothetical protein